MLRTLYGLYSPIQWRNVACWRPPAEKSSPPVGHHYVLGLKTDFLKLFLLNDFLEDKILPNSTLFIWGFYLELIKSYER